jgi:hypothetical protein
LTAEIDDDLFPVEDSESRVLRWRLQIIEIAGEEFRKIPYSFPQVIVDAQAVMTRKGQVRAVSSDCLTQITYINEYGG